MPGGLGNQKSRINEPEGQLYHETSVNGIKHLGAFFPNGMVAVSSPIFSIWCLRSYKRVLCDLRQHRANKVYSSAAIAAP